MSKSKTRKPALKGKKQQAQNLQKKIRTYVDGIRTIDAIKSVIDNGKKLFDWFLDGFRD
jgi:hypothetical protein